jgi:hypothetical protein
MRYNFVSFQRFAHAASEAWHAPEKIMQKKWHDIASLLWNPTEPLKASTAFGQALTEKTP